MRERSSLGSWLCRHRRREFGGAVVLLITGALLLTGCSRKVSTGNSNVTNQTAEAGNANSAPSPAGPSREELKAMADQQGQATAPDKGNFKVSYSEPRDEKYAQMYESLKVSGKLELLADELNAAIAIPEDVTIVFKQCGEINAKWSPQDHSIYICYELMEDVAQRLQSLTQGMRELEDAVGSATMFALFHEVGHCLMDLLKLPSTGREEEAVDQLATYVFVDSAGDDAGKMALKGAFWWGGKYDEMAQAGTAEGGLNQPWTDQHSFNAQRFYSIVCWVYGHDPDKYQEMVNNLLPEARAVLCPQEYARVSNAWAAPLKPYLKDGGKAAAAPTGEAPDRPAGGGTGGSGQSGR